MYDYRVFNEELKKIQSENLRDAVSRYLKEAVPDYFWSAPSSMSGKHHSSFDSGEGGLVRHTKMCVLVAEEMLRLEGFVTLNPDVVIAALLMHDTKKNGEGGSHYRVDHPRLAADAWLSFANSYRDEDMRRLREDIVWDIAYGIAWHSGQWTNPSTREEYPDRKDHLAVAKCTHLCDYIASRSFFDKIEEL